jgi:predicted DsbA family dithiol-disulfide isomerase
LRFRVVWEPFILNRSIPTTGVTISHYLQQVYGNSSGFESSRKRLAQVGAQCQPPIHFLNDPNALLYPTVHAHRLVEYYKQHDPSDEKHERLMEQLFHRYFELGKRLNDFDMLSEW